jgi:hypothetical protein
MNPTITAAIANQRHAQLVADALDYRRSHAARLPRHGRRVGPRVGADRVGRRSFSIHNWLTTGQL